MSRAKQKFQRESPIKAIQIVTDKKEVGTITLGDLTSSELKLVSQKPNANYFLGYFDYGKSYGLSVSLYTITSGRCVLISDLVITQYKTITLYFGYFCGLD